MKRRKYQWIVKLLLTIIVCAVICYFGYLILKKYGLLHVTREQLQDYISSKKALAPIIFILISFLQVTFIPIPGTITIIVGNYLFGFLPSVIYSFIGIFLGSINAFILGRIIGKKFVYWIAGDKQKVDEYLRKLHGKERVLLFFMFLFPFFPDDLLCSLAGILPITFKLFVIMQLITRSIGIICTILFMSGDIIPYQGWGIVVLICLGFIMLILFLYCYRNALKIEKFIIEKTKKIFSKKY